MGTYINLNEKKRNCLLFKHEFNLNIILQIKDKLKCSFTYSEGNIYLITCPSKRSVPDVDNKTVQRCCICLWKNLCCLDSRLTPLLCISQSSPQRTWLPQRCWLWRYLLATQGRSAQWGGLVGVSTWCTGSWATSTSRWGPFHRLVKLGPACWERGREFGFLMCHSGKHLVCWMKSQFLSTWSTNCHWRTFWRKEPEV